VPDPPPGDRHRDLGAWGLWVGLTIPGGEVTPPPWRRRWRQACLRRSGPRSTIPTPTESGSPAHPLLRIANLNGWKSPALGITLHFVDGVFTLDHADGTPFRTWPELVAAEAEHRRVAEAAEARAEAAQERAEAAQERADRLAERLRALGVDPDALG
jgi:hypothetical protein